MSYEAIIAKLENIRPHSNADRVQLAEVAGCQVVIGLENTEGQLGVFFLDDGCLSVEMAKRNNLHSASELNLDPKKKGYFGKNRRVRAQKFRGEKSYGFWIELSALEWTGVNLDTLEEGFTFTHLNGKEVCKKYINPATLRHAGGQNKAKGLSPLQKIKHRFPSFKEHVDTKQFNYEKSRIPAGSLLYITEKVHGTSGRTGNILGKLPLTSAQKWWNRYFWWTGKRYIHPEEYQIVSGTRRVVLNPDQTKENGYYSGNTFRIDIHNRFKELNIKKGLTFYYEICGFTEQGLAIMHRQSTNKIDDKKLRKIVKQTYGDKMIYAYGCRADDELLKNRYRTFVYRVTTTNIDGETIELPWPQVKKVCSELGLAVVPDLIPDSVINPYFFLEQSSDERECLTKLLEELLDKQSSIDGSHVIEGVVVRVETPTGEIYFLKNKSFIFKLLEGIMKNNPDIVDTEEAEDFVLEGDVHE